ncbi:hypothetical protein PQR70_10780 [Paraburkholderia madseniana]|uniref:Uncharacterized protein n=1 Tax=Paraburkholderia madseniana TaxID=2599607 RepID=A0AAP5B9L0_9BURK|nr:MULTISPECIES: hypothetical protein [Paraburkholderia]MCX4144623.1 hypothetical protein [Paraburkholderia madseniana]MDN7147575.1 hypothetical protein [Paraburkholderia sp. WS6]MDQ6406455.1 hypothetical protein [Paraburkholderia madseniana]
MYAKCAIEKIRADSVEWQAGVGHALQQTVVARAMDQYATPERLGGNSK